MANPIYRESWTKANGWSVRAEFIAGGGTAKRYSGRSVTNVTGVFETVSEHHGGFEALPFGMADGETCKFTVNYENCPTAMKTALADQYRTVTNSEFGPDTFDYYRNMTFFPRYDAVFPPRQPNLFMVWSDRGTGNGVPATVSITTAGSGYTSDTLVDTTRVPTSGAMDLVRGSGLKVSYIAANNVVNTYTLLTGGTGYSDGHAIATTGGTGTGCTVDITTSGGVITSLDAIANGGTGYTVTDVLTIAGGTGGTFEVTGVTGSGEVTSITAISGGTKYRVGDVVTIIGGDNEATITIDSLVASSWTPEFLGCQRISPSIKYTVTPAGLQITVEAVSVHKLALEAINDLTTFTTNFMSTQSDVIASPPEFNAAKYSWVDGITDYEYYGSTTGTLGHIRQAYSGKLIHWHAPLGAIFKYLDAAYREAMEYYLMTGYQGSQTYGLSGAYPATDSRIKLFRSAVMTDYYNPSLGATSGSLHDSAGELTEIRFIFCVTESVTHNGNDAYIYPNKWLGGLFTNDKDAVKKDCASAWDLVRMLAEQFYLKITPDYEWDGTTLQATFNISAPYGTTYSNGTLDYNSGAGDHAEFESNADRIDGVKYHNFVQSQDEEIIEITGVNRSDKKIEMNHLFNIRHRTPKDSSNMKAYVHSDGFGVVLIPMSSAHIRGIYALDYTSTPTVGAKETRIKAVSPRITFTYDTGSTTATVGNDDLWNGTNMSQDVWLYALSGNRGSVALVQKDIFLDRIRYYETQPQGFYYVMRNYLSMFGSYYNHITEGFEQDGNNQTKYEMDLPLYDYYLPHRVGSQATITPHSAMSGTIAERSYLISTEVNWDNKGAESNLVKTVWLTRNYNFD